VGPERAPPDCGSGAGQEAHPGRAEHSIGGVRCDGAGGLGRLARPVHLIITMIKWIRTSRLSIIESGPARIRARAGDLGLRDPGRLVTPEQGRCRGVEQDLWCCGTEAGSYVTFIDSCITQLKAQGPSRTCNESKEEVSPEQGRCRGVEQDSLFLSHSLAHSLTLSLSLSHLLSHSLTLTLSLSLPLFHSHLWTACGQREGDSCRGGGLLLRGAGVAAALLVVALALLRLCPLLRGHGEGGVARRSSISLGWDFCENPSRVDEFK